jgi:arsenate-mycothiol transferase
MTRGEAEPASVLFVCVRNGGKSQMAAGLMHHAAPSVAVHSAGTDPGPTLNALSVQVLNEIGIDITSEKPQAIDPQLLRSVDLVVTLGREAHVEVPDCVALRNWDTDEPSERGIDGIERMRLVRDDIAQHVDALAAELRPAPR